MRNLPWYSLLHPYPVRMGRKEVMHRLLLPQGAVRAQREKYTFSLNKVRKKAHLKQHMVLPVCSLKFMYDLAGHLADM